VQCDSLLQHGINVFGTVHFKKGNSTTSASTFATFGNVNASAVGALVPHLREAIQSASKAPGDKCIYY
jgi:hypothetical protein